MRRLTTRARRIAAATLERAAQRLAPDSDFLQRLEDVLEAHPGAAVALVAGPTEATGTATRLTAAGRRVHRVDPTRAGGAGGAVAGDLDVELAALGGVQVAVVEAPGSSERAVVVERLVHHLAGGGVVLVRAVEDDGLAAIVAAWADRGSVAGPDAPTRPGRGRRLGAVRVERFGPHAEVTAVTGQFLKLREEQATAYLAAAGPRAGRALETLEAVRWPSRARVREGGDRPKPLPTAYDVPELTLREYHDVRCYPGQVAVQGSVILPDSFRHNQRRTLHNQRLRTVAEPFAAPAQLRADVVPLQGTYFYLDSSYRGHFGHAMTEQLSRLWAWDRAKREFPGLKALMLAGKRTELYGFETELYSAAGVPPEDVVLAPGPVSVERLVAATPMFSQPDYIHPGIGALYERVSDTLSARAPEGDRPARFFCSRRHGKRACNNTDEVERLFTDHGFTVVFPEDHTLADQARMFREAEVVAGFAGSALFNLLFATAPTTVLMLASENYWAQNEYMIASVLGHDLTVAWCRPDVPRVPGAPFDPQVFHSPFTFDPEREGRVLREALGDL